MLVINEYRGEKNKKQWRERETRMPEEKEVVVNITRHYIWAWAYGLVGVGCFWYGHWIVGTIMFLFSFSSSMLDAQQSRAFDEPPKGPPPTDNDLKPS